MVFIYQKMEEKIKGKIVTKFKNYQTDLKREIMERKLELEEKLMCNLIEE